MRVLVICGVAAVLCGVLLAVGSVCCAVTWVKTFASDSLDEGTSVQQTPDGGYIVAGIRGRTESYDKGDVWLIRLDGQGNDIWSQVYGDSGRDWGWCVDQTSDGGYIVIGVYEKGQPQPTLDMWLIKTDSLGQMEWERKYGGPGGGDSDEGFYVEQTTDGGYMAMARTYSYGAGECDIWFLKTDVAGDSVWAQTYGGPAFEEVRCGQQTADGGYVACGLTRSFSGWGDCDQWLLKTDADGNIEWTRTIGLGGDDWAWTVRQNADLDYFIGGELDGVGGRIASIAKYDSLGTPIWLREFGMLGLVTVYSLWPVDNGGVVATGMVEGGGVFLLKVGGSGETQWASGFEGMWGYSVRQTEDRGYVIAGKTRGLYGDLLVIKTDSLGKVGVEEESQAPGQTRPRPHLVVHPNPCFGPTMIDYSLPASGHVSISIYDVVGRLVETVLDERKSPGTHSIMWNSDRLESGSYFCQLVTGDCRDSKRITVLR